MQDEVAKCKLTHALGGNDVPLPILAMHTLRALPSFESNFERIR
jgi:hypothetical protein